jgi:hypothetical protein
MQAQCPDASPLQYREDEPRPATYRPVGAGAGAFVPVFLVGGAGFGAGLGAPPPLVAPAGRLAGCDAGGMPTGVGALTVTVVCPLTLPSVAVMCAVPGLRPSPFPLVSTLTTLAASLVHVTVFVMSAVVLSAQVPVQALFVTVSVPELTMPPPALPCVIVNPLIVTVPLSTVKTVAPPLGLNPGPGSQPVQLP